MLRVACGTLCPTKGVAIRRALFALTRNVLVQRTRKILYFLLKIIDRDYYNFYMPQTGMVVQVS